MSEPNFESNFELIRRPLIARLTQKFGSSHLESILDAVQESFVTAISSWPHHGIPDRPSAWLFRVAERRLIDQLRVLRREVEPAEELTEEMVCGTSEIGLYVMVCSPKLSIREQVCLALRTLSGLTAQEIGRLLGESEEAVQRRISRSKDKISAEDLSVRNVEEHIPTILATLYLLFTEGYQAGRGEEYIRPDLAYSALRLSEELRDMLVSDHSELDALLALMHFHCARLAGRVNEDGEMLFLDEQDSSQLNQVHVAKGFRYLSLSQSANVISRYHLEAGLAAAFVRNAPDEEVLYWHELLVTHFATPLNLISYALAIARVYGVEQGLEKLTSFQERIEREQPAHFHSAMAYLLTERGEIGSARTHYQKAMAHSMSGPSMRGLERRFQSLHCG